jgi:hypothetical protein
MFASISQKYSTGMFNLYRHLKNIYTLTNNYIRKIVIKVLPYVLRNVNELNIPSGDKHGYEILYFGVNLILMFDYRLSFRIEVNSPENNDAIEVLIISRKDVSAWKGSSYRDNNNSSSIEQHIKTYYSNKGQKITDVFKPPVSNAYAFIFSNRSSSHNYRQFGTKTVKVFLTHSWHQEIKESQLRNK